MLPSRQRTHDPRCEQKRDRDGRASAGFPVSEILPNACYSISSEERLGGALGLARLLTSLLFGVKANDPFVFVAVGSVLALIALAECWIPARRATRIDPATALRYE